jgi:hypothetical protein
MNASLTAGRIMPAGLSNDMDRRMLPEAELWTEVIRQAIKDLSSQQPSNQQCALLWFNSSSDAVGTFIWACHVINIEPSCVRSALQEHALLRECPPEIMPKPIRSQVARRLGTAA